ncbi:MAG: metallophosphoesterase [Myxococcota bacterium]|nr:metallophosphoesterase [Myxococcota bacterium]
MLDGSLEHPRGDGGFLLAHLSDLHATEVRIDAPWELFGKRGLGFASWRLRRRHAHRPEVVEALLRDLSSVETHHVAITGDLTQIGLRSEIGRAAAILERIGPPQRVSLVPGNHDAYGGFRGEERWASWGAYMRGDDPAGRASRAGRAEFGSGFPYVRRRDRIAFVGLSSALPTAPWLATGRLGPQQLARAEAALAQLGGVDVFRIVLLHHPPLPCGQAPRRQLDDAEALRAVLARTGAELILHGHTHRTSIESVPGPQAPIPVVSVPSASDVGHRPERRARYHIYRIGPEGEIGCEIRGYDPASGEFKPEGRRTL